MKDLTEGKPIRIIFNFALPMLLGNVFQQLYNIVDSVIVGNFLGKEALAAVGASFPIIFTLISLIIGVASGTTVVIAQYFGAKNLANVRKAIDTMYIFLFIASLFLTVFGIVFSKQIFALIQLPEEIMPQANIYLRVYLIGLVGFFGFNGTSAVLRGLGDSKTPLYFLILSTLFNIGFDLLFVVVFKWGIAGVALATVISQTGAFISLIIYLNRNHEVVKFSIKKLLFDWDIFRKSLKIGLPTGFQHTFVSLGMMALFGIVNTFGTNVIAAYSVAGRIDALALLPAMNFAQALSTYVGQNIGANKTSRVAAGLNSTFLMSSVITIFVMVIVIFFSGFMMDLFTDDENVITIGVEYLRIVSSFYLLFTAMFTVNGVMRGAGDTLIPMFITLFSLWIIRIPAAWILSQRFGETGIWYAVPVAWAIGTFFSYIYYKSGKWKTKGVVKHKP